MTSQEMIYNFRSELGGFAQNTQGYEPTTDDILYFLNKSQLNFVKDNFSGINERREGFEQSQRLIDELRILYVKDITLDTVYGGVAKSNFYIDKAEIPSDCMFVISTRSRLTYVSNYDSISISQNGRFLGDTTKPYIENIIVDNDFSQSDDIYSLLSDPFNTTKKTSPLTDINGDYINVYTDKTFFVDKILNHS